MTPGPRPARGHMPFNRHRRASEWFKPKPMSVRDASICRLYETGSTQTQIGGYHGLSQARVSSILRSYGIMRTSRKMAA